VSPVSQIDVWLARLDVRNFADLNSNIGKRNYQRGMEKSAVGLPRERYRENVKNWPCCGGLMDGWRLYFINKVAAKECTLLERVDSSSLSVISTTRATTNSQLGGRLSTSAVELGNNYQKRRQRRRMSYWRSLNSQWETRDPIQYRAQYYRYKLSIRNRYQVLFLYNNPSIVKSSVLIEDKRNVMLCEFSGNFRSRLVLIYILQVIIHKWNGWIDDIYYHIYIQYIIDNDKIREWDIWKYCRLLWFEADFSRSESFISREK